MWTGNDLVRFIVSSIKDKYWLSHFGVE